MSVRVNFEIGHEASIRTKKTVEGFTHDWEVFVRGCDGTQLPYFVEKVVFYLHETFPNPKRVIKQPPYAVKESGYAGFVLPIEVYIKHDPKRVKFHYDLTLQTSGPAVRNVQKEQYVFKNPTDELKSCLLKGGGVIVSSNNIHDTPDSRLPSELKNELVNKPKLSGSDIAMKKHRNKMDEQRSSNSFQDLFGTPITKTNKVFSDPKSISKDVGTPKAGGNSLSNSKPDKDREKSKDKTKLSPNKEREKDKDGEKRKDKQESDRRKERDEKKNKEKSRDRAHSKEKVSKREKSPRPTASPSPKRSPKRLPSPKRPPSPPPVRYKEKEDKRTESNKEREKKDKSDEKSDKKSKKEKRDREHKENRSKERESQKNIEHKEHKSKEKSSKESGKEGESPSSKKSDRKEKKEIKDDKEAEPKITTPDRSDKKIDKSEEKKEKHKHKKKDKEKKEKDKDKKDKLKEKDKPVIKKDVEPPKQESKEEKEGLFLAAKNEDRSKKHSLFSEDLSNSSTSSKEDSFAEALHEAKKESLFEPSSKRPKPDGEKIKKEKTKKNKDKKAEKEEKKRKRKAEREPPEEPPEKEVKIESRKPEPSDSEPSPQRPQSDLDKENQENPEEYMEVLKDLQTKIVNLRDNSELQRVVQLIAQTGRYEVSQNTFDFDLCLLEKSTVKQLQEFFASS